LRNDFPSGLINVGIAEQTDGRARAGLANAGKIPFVAPPRAFLTGRALEQIKADVAYSDANVKACGRVPEWPYGRAWPHPSLDRGPAWTRAIANLTVIPPLMRPTRRYALVAETHGPCFCASVACRYPPSMMTSTSFCNRARGAAAAGRDVTLIANGTMVSRATEAATSLLHDGGWTRAWLNMSTVRPIDRDAIIAAASETGRIVTVEEHSIYGGLGSAWPRWCARLRPVPMRILACPGCLCSDPVQSGGCFEYFNLTQAESVMQRWSWWKTRLAAWNGECILAIDQGTTNTKAVLVDAFRHDPRSGIAALACSTRGRWVEQDPRPLWSSVLQVIEECLSAAFGRTPAASGDHQPARNHRVMGSPDRRARWGRRSSGSVTARRRSVRSCLRAEWSHSCERTGQIHAHVDGLAQLAAAHARWRSRGAPASSVR